MDNQTTGYTVGEKYLNAKGTAVVYQGLTETGEKMKVECLNGKIVEVPLGYELQPYDESKVNGMSKSLMDNNGGTVRNKAKAFKEPRPTLAVKIDKYLLTGQYTVKQIAELVKDEPEAADKNVLSNVHARIIGYKRKGATVEKNEAGQVQITLKKQ
ncbi:MAG: hypothetical protein A2252_06305 [Elusimicrobia bacterium RIFOXYA2_FULL_39_19]|nr:MAG: hypothetical protein A2252_06305 [Elusimicrobia bacterium RIFOXYA2_FULL_39_19]